MNENIDRDVGIWTLLENIDDDACISKLTVKNNRGVGIQTLRDNIDEVVGIYRLQENIAEY